MDNATTVQYASLLHSLVANARNCVRDTDPQNDLTFLRVRSKKHEIMIAPGRLHFPDHQRMSDRISRIHVLTGELSFFIEICVL